MTDLTQKVENEGAEVMELGELDATDVLVFPYDEDRTKYVAADKYGLRGRHCYDFENGKVKTFETSREVKKLDGTILFGHGLAEELDVNGVVSLDKYRGLEDAYYDILKELDSAKIAVGLLEEAGKSLQESLEEEQDRLNLIYKLFFYTYKVVYNLPGGYTRWLKELGMNLEEEEVTNLFDVVSDLHERVFDRELEDPWENATLD